MKKIFKEYDISIVDVVIFLAIVLILVGALGGKIIQASNKRTNVCTVTGKEVKTDNGKGKYLIYTKDYPTGEVMVYRIEDTVLRWQWDSSDKYATVEDGKTYKFTIVGYRLPILSMYPNIIDIKELN